MAYRNILVIQALLFLILGFYLLNINISEDSQILGITGNQIADIMSDDEINDLSDIKFMSSTTGFILIALSILEFILIGSTMMYKK